MAGRTHGLRNFALLAIGIAVSTIGVGRLLASDHMDTPEVELNLERALTINPGFNYAQAKIARAALESLSRG